MNELRRLDSVVSPHMRQQAAQAASEADQASYCIRALWQFMNLASPHSLQLSMAKAVKPKDWEAWAKDMPLMGSSSQHAPGSSAQTMLPCTAPTSTAIKRHQSDKHVKSKSQHSGAAEVNRNRGQHVVAGVKGTAAAEPPEHGFRRAAAAHAAWKETLSKRRARYAGLPAEDLDSLLRGVWEAYIDRHAFSTTGEQHMTTRGFMRLMYDCCLLDNMTTPSVVDTLLQSLPHAQPHVQAGTARASTTAASLTCIAATGQKKELCMDYATFRHAVARVAAHRASARVLLGQTFKHNAPAPDIHHEAFLAPFVNLFLPEHWPAPAVRPHQFGHSSSLRNRSVSSVGTRRLRTSQDGSFNTRSSSKPRSTDGNGHKLSARASNSKVWYPPALTMLQGETPASTAPCSRAASHTGITPAMSACSAVSFSLGCIQDPPKQPAVQTQPSQQQAPRQLSQLLQPMAERGASQQSTQGGLLHGSAAAAASALSSRLSWLDLSPVIPAAPHGHHHQLQSQSPSSSHPHPHRHPQPHPQPHPSPSKTAATRPSQVAAAVAEPPLAAERQSTITPALPTVFRPAPAKVTPPPVPASQQALAQAMQAAAVVAAAQERVKHVCMQAAASCACTDEASVQTAWLCLVQEWVLPLSRPEGTAKPCPILDALFCRDTLDMLRLYAEPALRRMFAYYWQLGSLGNASIPPSALADTGGLAAPWLSSWLRIVGEHAALDARLVVELCRNLRVVPMFLTRADVVAAYTHCPAPAGHTSMLYDGGHSFSRFLVTMAIVAQKVAGGLRQRMHVHVTPEEMKAMRQYIAGYGPQQQREELEEALSDMHAARRAAMHDVHRESAGMDFYQYQAQRLMGEQRNHAAQQATQGVLQVLNRREDMRQRMALTRLHNYLSDVRAITAPTSGSLSCACLPTLHKTLQKQSGASSWLAQGNCVQVSSSAPASICHRPGNAHSLIQSEGTEDGPLTGPAVQSPKRNIAFFSGDLQIKTPKVVAMLPPASAAAARNFGLDPMSRAGRLGTGQRRRSIEVMQIEPRDQCDVLKEFTQTLPNLVLHNSTFKMSADCSFSTAGSAPRCSTGVSAPCSAPRTAIVAKEAKQALAAVAALPGVEAT